MYSNARKGIRKIFSYEVIEIVVALLAILIAVLGVVSFDADKALAGDKEALGSGLVIIIAGIAIVVLTIIGIIILIKGLRLAAMDEREHFKGAFYASLIVLVGSVLLGLSSTVEFIGDYKKYINAAVSGTNIFMFMSIVFGIRKIAEKIGRSDIVSMSVPIIAITIIITCVSAIGRFIENDTMEVASEILTLISYVIYLVYLSKAKKMFDGVK